MPRALTIKTIAHSAAGKFTPFNDTSHNNSWQKLEYISTTNNPLSLHKPSHMLMLFHLSLPSLLLTFRLTNENKLPLPIASQHSGVQLFHAFVSAFLTVASFQNSHPFLHLKCFPEKHKRMAEAKTHFRSHKQARAQKLSEQ